MFSGAKNMDVGRLKTDQEWLEKGYEHYNRGQYEDALKCFDKAIEVNSKYDLPWVNKGLALYRLGKHEESETCFSTALKIDPQDEAAKKAREELTEKIKKLKEDEKPLSVEINFPEVMEYGAYNLSIQFRNEKNEDVKQLVVDFSEVAEYFECPEKTIDFPTLKPEMWLEKDISLKPKFKGIMKFGVTIKSNLEEIKKDFKVEVVEGKGNKDAPGDMT